MLDTIVGAAIALVVFVAAVLLIRVVCGRPRLRRLNLALTLTALAGSLALFRYLAPMPLARLNPYLQVLIIFAPAYTVFKIVEVLTLDVMAVRHERVPPPAILRDIVSALFAGLVLVLLLQANLGVDITTLVATSAALSIVLGLALQETLANLFAGLALMIERPFEPGDWVRVGERVGRVKEVSWRAVKFQLLKQEDYLIIPNSVVAKTEIVNLSQPTPLHGQSVEIGVVYDEPPTRVCRLLVDTAQEVDGVVAEPPPSAVLVRFGDSAIMYRLTFWIREFARVSDIEGDVLAHVWYAFRRQGIQIPFPIQDVHWRSASELEAAAERRRLERISTLLKGVDFLAALTQDEVERLAGEVRIAPFPAGMVVVQQGDEGDSLFVIATGRVQVSALPAGGGPERALAVLEPGDYFGEMSLLTGAPRSATIRTLEDTELLVLTRDALRPVLLSDPAAAERLSQTLAKRKAEQTDTVQRLATEARGPGADVSGFLLGRIRRFFGLIGGES